MGEQLRDNYFIIVRTVLMIVLSIYGFFGFESGNPQTGVSVRILLLISFYIFVMVLRELFPRYRFACIMIGAVVYAFLLTGGGAGFVFLGFQLAYEILIMLKVRILWYFVPLLFLLVDSPARNITSYIFVTLIMLLYMQDQFVVSVYKKEIMEGTVTQQFLKKDIKDQEDAAKEEIKRNALRAEKEILEERASLSQTLHDKLGHSINGSIYQLEAGKLLMNKDPGKAADMIQAVIDQLRSGMDEIRMILRKERPEKKKMSLLQLHELCEDCIEKGVDAELATEGDIELISNEMWEIILDNTFEAVANSMKYSKCNRIMIKINVMNKMIRCEISDNGIGCGTIVDGMGISGMRQRVRSIGGIIDFESEAGFKVSMLLPL